MSNTSVKRLILEKIAGVFFLRLKKLQNYLNLKKFKRNVAIFADLCNFIDSLFYKLTEETKECSILIRSESSIREDLKRWGVNFGSSISIYFEVHEGPDVVADREQYVDYFLSRQKNYYRIDNLGENWISPIEKPCVLMFHDELTFRCVEQFSKRWYVKDK